MPYVDGVTVLSMAQQMTYGVIAELERGSRLGTKSHELIEDGIEHLCFRV